MLARLLERWIDHTPPAAVPNRPHAPPGPLDPETLSQLLELAAHDPAGIAELAHLFVRNARERIDSAAAAAAQGDLAAVSRTAHSLKGSSGTLAAAAMAALCGDLEEACAAGDTTVVVDLIARLDSEFAQVADAVRAALDPGRLVAPSRNGSVRESG